MADDGRHPFLTDLQDTLYPLLARGSEVAILALLGAVPFVGDMLVSNRKILNGLTSIFESDDKVQRDIARVVQSMNETEEVLARLKVHVDTRKNELQQTLEEYKRFKELAAVEQEKALPILNELRHESNKGLMWGFIINLVVLLIGIVIGHYLKVWYPNF